MKRFLSVLFFLTTFALAVLTAQSSMLEGEWMVEGENPEGDAYEGSLNMEPINNLLYKLNWDIKYEDEKGKQQFPGTGLYDKKANIMYAAYGINTYRYGLVEYALNDKGGLQGNGSWTSHQGVGAELLAGQLNRSRIEGTYRVVGRRSKGDIAMGASETYEGTLKVRKEGEMYHLEWYLGDGTPYKGFAYRRGNNLVGVWGIGGSYGLEIYKFDADKNQATSTWTTPNYNYEQGKETITKK
jgi:hypothetical protein